MKDTELEKLWQKKYGNCNVGYSEDMRPNEDWEDMGMICPYSHCIETMPLHPSNPPKGCPIFEHLCPGGSKQAKVCQEDVRGNENGKSFDRSGQKGRQGLSRNPL